MELDLDAVLWMILRSEELSLLRVFVSAAAKKASLIEQKEGAKVVFLLFGCETLHWEGEKMGLVEVDSMKRRC